MLSVQQVADVRAQLWDAGFRPVAIRTGGKEPIGLDWPTRARQDPPECLRFTPVAHALNTGILSDGLRAIDIDVDDIDAARQCRALVLERFGEAPIRYRNNSPRCLILYRAESGTPSKVAIVGKLGKVEALGRGQQFVAFGTHPSGADLEWFPDSPGQEGIQSIPAISEDALLDLLEQMAPIIEAPAPKRANGHDHEASEPQADPLRIAAALAAIPNDKPADWEYWNYVGMAAWRATGGNSAGWEAFNAWSARNPSYDAEATRARWDHYATSPPTQLGAGTIFHLANEASPYGFFRRQHPQPDTQDIDPDRPDIFPVEHFHDIQITADASDFVEGLLVNGSMAIVYGESNSGKTFFVSDLALHVACGWAWNGREVDQGAVVYLAMEGAHGIRNRIAAFRQAHGIAPQAFVPFYVIPVSMNLLDPKADVERLLRTVRHVCKDLAVPLRMIVVDTLSRALAGGNENAPDDMGAIVTNGTRIQQETGANVVWIHHSGKDQAKGARGHSLLRAATDTEIEVTADGQDRRATVTKQREMECIGEFPFVLEVVELGTNKRGKAVTSCVVSHKNSDLQTPRQPTRRLIGHAKRALELLQDALADQGQTGYGGVPAGLPSIPDQWWRDRFYDRAMPGEKNDTKQKAFNRATTHLINERLVGMANKRVWIAGRNSHDAPSQNRT